MKWISTALLLGGRWGAHTYKLARGERGFLVVVMTDTEDEEAGRAQVVAPVAGLADLARQHAQHAGVSG